MHIFLALVDNKFGTLHLLPVYLCVAMARFIAIILTLVNCMPFETSGQLNCSTKGVAGLAGCECNFFGACDFRGRIRPGVDILNHSPNGIERYAHEKGSFGRNIAFLCEGSTVAILYDCNNRIPLYAATVVSGGQLSAKFGKRPRGTGGTFRQSGTTLDLYFQQVKNDYDQALNRKIYYKIKTRRSIKQIKDKVWYEKLNPTLLSNNVKVAVHRGHMIASLYGIGDLAKKVNTFVYTNAIPQFGVFNSGPWKTCEGRLIRWGQVFCLREGTADVVRNVQMFIVVGAIPSTFNNGRDPLKTRFFGNGGFSDYQDDTSFRVNVPSAMWTAACCTFEYIKGRRTYSVTKNTAFWGKNVPGNDECDKVYVHKLEDKLTPKGETQINLFPSSKECRNIHNFQVI